MISYNANAAQRVTILPKISNKLRYYSTVILALYLKVIHKNKISYSKQRQISYIHY